MFPDRTTLRKEREHSRTEGADQRDPYQRDRDRILYSDAFRRLDGVTQVVSSAEGHTVHNRLTHTLKVAQIGRRLTEYLCREYSELTQACDLQPDVVEAACLAHDLGHPPFGHIAEHELDVLVRKADDYEGFEGNAQSFRIVTMLSPRKDDAKGLDLTRATLNAILKYPWMRDNSREHSRKWGAYRSEAESFRFARLGSKGKLKSLEAQIMTWADDIAYAIHDTEDFYRAGMIPLHKFARLGEDGEREVNSFATAVFDRWEEHGDYRSEEDKAKLTNAWRAIKQFFPAEPYNGSRESRQRIKNFSSSQIGLLVRKTTLVEKDDGVELGIPEAQQQTIEMLKELTWVYVINNPSLAAQQEGQRRIIRTLFDVFADAVSTTNPRWHVLPRFYHEELKILCGDGRKAEIPKTKLIRTVADCIAGMTEGEAIRIYHRLTGVSMGSVFDSIMN